MNIINNKIYKIGLEIFKNAENNQAVYSLIEEILGLKQVIINNSNYKIYIGIILFGLISSGHDVSTGLFHYFNIENEKNKQLVFNIGKTLSKKQGWAQNALNILSREYSDSIIKITNIPVQKSITKSLSLEKDDTKVIKDDYDTIYMLGRHVFNDIGENEKSYRLIEEILQIRSNRINERNYIFFINVILRALMINHHDIDFNLYLYFSKKISSDGIEMLSKFYSKKDGWDKHAIYILSRYYSPITKYKIKKVQMEEMNYKMKYLKYKNKYMVLRDNKGFR